MKSDVEAPWRREFPWEPHFAQIDDERMHFIDEGEGDVLLLVHGNPTWSFYWRHWLPELRRHYRVVAPDHIGSGLSDKPQRYPYRLRQHSRNLYLLLDQLQIDRCTLIGHDWGGAIGSACRTHRLPGKIGSSHLAEYGRVSATSHSAANPCMPVAGHWQLSGTRIERLPSSCPPDGGFPVTAIQTCANGPAFWGPIPIGGRGWVSGALSATFPTVRVIQPGTTSSSWRTPWYDFVRSPSGLIWGMKDWCFDDVCLQRLDAANSARRHFSAGPSRALGRRRFARVKRWTPSNNFCCNTPSAMPPPSHLSIREAATLACLLESAAAKPGNVHRGADFEDLTYQDMLVSGVCVGDVMAFATTSSLGQLVLRAVTSIRQRVGRNTYLGTVLLMAPLAKSKLWVDSHPAWSCQRGHVLQQLTARDAADVYQAIVLAEPGGLGTVPANGRPRDPLPPTCASP